MAARPTIDPVMAGHRGFSCKIGCTVGDKGGLWSVRDSSTVCASEMFTMYGALHTLFRKPFVRDLFGINTRGFTFEKENPTNGEKDVDKPESL